MSTQWKAPEIVHHPDHISKCNKGEMSWDSFHKLVSKNCGAFLTEKGEGDMKSIMESHIRLANAKKQNSNSDIDKFMDYVDDKRFEKFGQF